MKPIDRSSVNQEQYSAPEFGKSGFDLSYRNYTSFLLGRIHVSGFQDCMPGDKISGQNKGNFTLNRIVTPMVAPLEVAQYDMFIPYRALDRTFERAFAPSKNNSMSANWSAPSFNLKTLYQYLMYDFFGFDGVSDQLSIKSTFLGLLDGDSSKLLSSLTGWGTTSCPIYGTNGIVTKMYSWIKNSSNPLYKYLSNMYLLDALDDVRDYIYSRIGDKDNQLSGTTTFKDFYILLMDSICTPFIGRYSYLKELGYNYIRLRDWSEVFDDYQSPLDYDHFIAPFDSSMQNEYAIRAFYAIWYEHFRNVDLEPVSPDLPYWRDFGSTSIFANDSTDYHCGSVVFLLYRFRSWYKDLFTTAQIDDLSRHVFAPVYSSSASHVLGHVNSINNSLANNTSDSSDSFSGGSKPSIYSLTWLDQLSNTSKTIECPVPANINDLLSSLDLNSSDIYGLDLNSLRQSQMLERYLKRNYLFGDEYQDRMLAHYNSRVSDMRINRPEIIGRSLNSADYKQEVANVSTNQSNVGDRTATGTLKSDGDGFTTYCEEFGILIHIITFMPFAAYDGTINQRLIGKVVDYPLPEFASNNEEFGRIREIADAGANRLYSSGDPTHFYQFGRYPAYHAWRSRTDTVGGMFLQELQNCTFRRFWGLDSQLSSTFPRLNYTFIHCKPILQMFANTVRYDSQVYGDVYHECFVERVLPTPVEVI